MIAGLAACNLLVDTSGLQGEVTATAPTEAGPGESGSPANEAGSMSGDSGPGTEAGVDSGGSTRPPSCIGGGLGVSDCGPNREDCCASPPVAGGTYKRGHDGVVLFDFSDPAQVSPFRLDRFEVTVGRFRAFVAAVVGGWAPAAGSGKHSYLNQGAGLAVIAEAGAPHEPGWDSSRDADLPRTAPAWGTNLSCHATFQTWTNAPATNEHSPINCVSWLEAQAFCIWDGGFLPSETEAAYASQGGDQQRVYAWSAPPMSKSVDCTYQNGAGCAGGGASAPNAVGTESPKGDGRWLQADLGGNLREWTLDVYVDGYSNPCVDCVVLGAGTDRVTHGSGYFNDATGSVAGFRASASGRDFALGLRCARAP